ncbi:unnamed protein product [Cercospora beticola]|nr:unnamed protein product [Cercospora beticola]
MFNYTQAIYTRPCTKDSCLKASHKSSFSYHFPSWLAWKTLEFQHYSSGLASYGSTWSLRVNVDITHRDLGSQFLAAIGNTNTEAIRESITSGLIHSRMLFRGVPLLLYAYDFISREGYTYSHQRTYVPPDPLCNLLRRAGFAVTLDGHAEPRIYGEFVVQHLKGLGVGADDLADYLQFTAIHCATVLPEGGDASASDIIDNNVRDIDTPDAMGRTPLHWACATGSLDFVQALLEVNALPNSRDWAGMRPLHHACEGLAEVDSRTRVAVSETLLAYGADVNAVDEDGQTPLHQARDAETSQHLLDHDACVDALDKFGHTPLFYARDAAQVDVLIKHGAHLDHITNNGDAAIHLCSLLGRGGAVAALARHGANLYATTNRGKTPFHCAILVNSDQTLLALREANERDPRRDYPIYNNLGENYLHIAAYHADARTMAELLLFDLTGHHPDARESYGLTAEDVFRMYDGETCWERPGFSARNERRKVWEALVKKAREQNKDWRIEELDGDDDHFYDDAIEETYPMPGSFDTAWSK